MSSDKNTGEGMDNRDFVNHLNNIETPHFSNEEHQSALKEKLQLQMYRNSVSDKPVSRPVQQHLFKQISAAGILILLLVAGIGLLMNGKIGKTRFTVVSVNGESSYADADGKSAYLEDGDLLSQAKIINTGPDSTLRIQSRSGSMVNIGPNSTLSIKHSSITSGRERTDLYLEQGKIVCDVSHGKAGSLFTVVTDIVTVTVTGTIFKVNVDNKNCKVDVESGSVEITGFLDTDRIMLNEDARAVMTNEQINALLNMTLEINKGESINIDGSDQETWHNTLSSIVTRYRESTLKDSNSSTAVDRLEKDLVMMTSVMEKDISVITGNNSLEIDNNQYQIEESPTERFFEVKVTATDSGPFNTYDTATSKGPGNTLLVSSDTDSSITAIDVLTGRIQWKFTNNELRNITSPAVFFGNRILIATPESLFITGKNGKLLETFKITQGTTFWSRPLVTANGIIVPTSKTVIHLFDEIPAEIEGLPTANGQIYLGKTESEYIMNYSNDLVIHQVDSRTKRVTWSSNKLEDRSFTEPLVINNRIYIAGSSGSITEFTPDRRKPTAKGKVPAGLMSNLIHYDDKMYTVATDGYLYQIDSTNLKKIERLARVDNEPDVDTYRCKYLVIQNSLLYFNSDMGTLFVMDIQSRDTWFVDCETGGNPLVGTPIHFGKSMIALSSDGNIAIIETGFKQPE
jgi:hypothetical protein